MRQLIYNSFGLSPASDGEIFYPTFGYTLVVFFISLKKSTEVYLKHWIQISPSLVKVQLSHFLPSYNEFSCAKIFKVGFYLYRWDPSGKGNGNLR